MKKILQIAILLFSIIVSAQIDMSNKLIILDTPNTAAPSEFLVKTTGDNLIKATTFSRLLELIQSNLNFATKFTEFTDTPNSYSGLAGQFMKVNAAETALEATSDPTFNGVVINNEINTDDSFILINEKNGDGTTTEFKSFIVRNGKGENITVFDGDTKTVINYGDVHVGEAATNTSIVKLILASDVITKLSEIWAEGGDLHLKPDAVGDQVVIESGMTVGSTEGNTQKLILNGNTIQGGETTSPYTTQLRLIGLPVSMHHSTGLGSTIRLNTTNSGVEVNGTLKASQAVNVNDKVKIDSNGNIFADGSINIGGGYGDTGTTINSSGDILTNGALIANNGIVSNSTIVSDGDIKVGGGYGNTGITITADGGINARGNVVVAGSIESGSDLFHRSGIRILNKAENGWVRWVTKIGSEEETVVDLSSVRNITASGDVTFTKNDPRLYFDDTAGGSPVDYSIGANAGGFTIRNESSSNDMLKFNNNEVIIGNTTTDNTLRIISTGVTQNGISKIALMRANEETLIIETVPNVGARFIAKVANQGHLSFNTGSGSETLMLDRYNNAIFSGSVTGTVFIPTSDRNLKENIVEVLDPRKLDTKYYQYNLISDNEEEEGNKRMHYSVMAQDLLADGYSEYVYERSEIVTDENGEPVDIIRYGVNMTELHSEEIAYLKKENETQNSLINSLIERLRVLENTVNSTNYENK